jgi:hypothetical protein
MPKTKFLIHGNDSSFWWPSPGESGNDCGRMKRLRGRARADTRRVVLPLMGILALVGATYCRANRKSDAAGAASVAVSARTGPPSGSAPAAPAPGPCKTPGSLAPDSDVAAWFPVSIGSHCLDPLADVRRYGGKGEPPLAGACAALGVECETPVRLGLTRIVSVRYVGVKEELGRIGASVWSFGDPETALAYLTGRVAVDTELARSPVLLEGGAGGVLVGTGAALVRGAAVALFELEDERSTLAERSKRAAGVLPALARAVGERLPGSTRFPRAVELLPPEGRSLLTLRYEAFDLFGIAGVGRGARTHYDTPGGAEDLVALVRADEDAADDVMVTLRKVDGARRIKQAPYGAVRLRHEEGTKEPMDWVFGRKGTIVIGVGAPVVVLPKKKGAPKPPDKSLLRMKALLDRAAGR